MPDRDTVITITTHCFFFQTTKKEKWGETWVDFMSRNHYNAEQAINICILAKVSFMSDKNAIKCTTLTLKWINENYKSLATTFMSKIM